MKKLLTAESVKYLAHPSLVGSKNRHSPPLRMDSDNKIGTAIDWLSAVVHPWTCKSQALFKTRLDPCAWSFQDKTEKPKQIISATVFQQSSRVSSKWQLEISISRMISRADFSSCMLSAYSGQPLSAASKCRLDRPYIRSTPILCTHKNKYQTWARAEFEKNG